MESIDHATMVSCQRVAARLVQREAEFVEQLRLRFASLPQVPDDPRVAMTIGRSVLRVALFQDPPEVAAAVARQAGADLFRLGFVDSARQSAGHAVMHVLRDNYPGEWDSAASSAWIGLFLWVSARWAEGSDSARADEERFTAAQASNPATAAPDNQKPSVDDDFEDDDFDDDEPSGYGNIMLSMTRGNRGKRDDRNH